MNMRIVRIIAAMCCLSVLASCGGGGGGGTGGAPANSIVLKSDSAEETFTHTAVTAGGFQGYDPYVIAWHDTTSDNVYIYLYSNCATLPCDVEFRLSITGSQVGIPYAVALGGPVNAYFHDLRINSFNYPVEQSGSVTLTEIGQAGQPIKGTFDFILTNATYTYHTEHLSGSFNIPLLM